MSKDNGASLRDHAGRTSSRAGARLGHTATIDSADEFYIVDLRPEFIRNPYVTLWRPENAGYAYPLSWAGRYDRDTVEASAPYYYKRRYGCKRTLDRFPVPCAVVESMGIAPAPRMIDGDAGPVVPNLAPIRSALRRARYVPAQAIETRRATTCGRGAEHESAVGETDAPNPSPEISHD